MNIWRKILEQLTDSFNVLFSLYNNINKESFGDMLQAEYVFFIEHDFNRAISIYKDTLRKNPLYPVFISLHEICSIYQKRCGIGSGIASEIAKRYHFDVDNDDSF